MANGHRLADVWGYSLRAVDVYVGAIVKRQRQWLADLTSAIRHSQGTDPKVFQQFMRDLQGDE